MTDREKVHHPLDHATARIVTELAAALTPPLKETVSSELQRAVGSMPPDADREVEEALSSLRRVKALADDIASAFSSSENSALAVQNSAAALSGVIDSLLPLSSACDGINAAAERLAKLTIEPQSAPVQTDELLRSLEAGLSDLKTGFSDWNGVLKANGRAQTRELSEFSAEISEQIGWMRSAMPGMLEEVFEKTLSSRTKEWMRASNENIGALETRLTKLEKTGKILLTVGAIFIVLLAGLYFK